AESETAMTGMALVIMTLEGGRVSRGDKSERWRRPSAARPVKRLRPPPFAPLAASSSWVWESACYTPSLIVKVLQERRSYVIAGRIVIPSVLLHHTVCDVPGQVGKEKPPGVPFINFRVLCVGPHAQVQGNM